MKTVLRPLPFVQQEIRSSVGKLPTNTACAPGLPPNLRRRELENELLGPDHPELVPRDPLDVRWVAAEGFDLALERGDLADEFLVGLPELLKLLP